jgi:hypothetical protein
MALTKATFSMIAGAPVNVDDFIPAGTNTATTDCAAFIQAAINAASAEGGRGVVFSQKTYRINSSLTISTNSLSIDGRGAVLEHYGSSFGIGFGLIGGTIYPTEISISRLAIYVNTAGASGIQVRTSYSQYEEVGILVRSTATNGNAWILVGDETNGSGPYYNVFLRCTAQSQSAATDHIGWNFVTSAPANRGPNSNQWFGGRTGQFRIAFNITGTGNYWFGHTVEGVNGVGTNYKFIAPAVGKCTGNIIFGGYCELASIGFEFGTNTSGNAFYSPYVTGVTTLITDNGTDNYWVSSDTYSRLSTGVSPNGNASTDPEVLDAYEEGTWTPTLVGGTTAGSYIVSTSSAKYTRIGQQVTVTAGMSITVTSAGTGVLKFGGLPFAKDTGEFITGSVTLGSATLNASTRSLAIGSTTSSTESFFVINQTRTGAAILELDCADVSGSFTAFVTFTYTVLN